jgi:hypothetical protein
VYLSSKLFKSPRPIKIEKPHSEEEENKKFHSGKPLCHILKGMVDNLTLCMTDPSIH